MHILMIEDNADWKAGFKEELTKGLTGLRFTDAGDAKAAHDAISAGTSDDPFHLIILDLHLPSTAISNDASVHYGIAIYREILSQIPGIPLLVLSGEAETSDVGQLMEQPQMARLFGGQQLNLCRFVDKSLPLPAPAFIRQISEELAQLLTIELNPAGLASIKLAQDVSIVLKSFVRGRQCKSARISVLGGGLSGAGVYAMTLFNFAGAESMQVVAKVGNTKKIDAERIAHNRLAPLRIGCFPHLIGSEPIPFGRISGLFMRIADGHEHDLFDCLNSNETKSSAIVQVLQRDFAQFVAGAQTLAGSAALAKLNGFYLATVSSEARKKIPAHIDMTKVFDAMKSVTLVWGQQHGDLHCGNILVDAAIERCILIDCADVDERPIGFDAIYLELMLFFHPKAKKLFPSLVNVSRASKWPDIMGVCEGIPIGIFVGACRKWQDTVIGATSQKVVFFVALSIALRQLRYPDVSDELALAIAKACYENIVS